MDVTGMVLATAVAFVGTHFVMSHPLRGPLVRAMGERGFLGFYIVVSFATLGWLAYAYYVAPPAPPIWPAGDTLWAIAAAELRIDSSLLLGSRVGTPAFPDPRHQPRLPAAPPGALALHNHPPWGGGGRR